MLYNVENMYVHCIYLKNNGNHVIAIGYASSEKEFNEMIK